MIGKMTALLLAGTLLTAGLMTGCGDSGSASMEAQAGTAAETAAGNGNSADEETSAESSSGQAKENSGGQAEENSSQAKESSGGKNAADTDDIQEATRQVFAMDTYMSVTAYGSGDSAEKAVEAAEKEINRLDALFSTGEESSEVSEINAEGQGKLSEDGAYLMKYALRLYQETEGSYDISIYPVMKLWGFTDQNYKVPSEKELKKALDLVDGSKIDYDEEMRQVTFEKEGMAIDFGSIAKGYTSDRIMKIFEENGVISGLVNLGGNVQCYRQKTDGSDWRVAIQTPEKDENYLGVLSCADKAVITSGGYERYFEEDGKTYHHIIDPATGYPADSGLLSSSIVCSDGTLADGLSTSLFILGKDRAIEYWRAHSDEFDFILLQEDGTLLVTEGIADDFETELEMQIIRADGK